jgi:hypothetical protein
MDESKQARLNELTDELAALLYEETDPEAVQTQEGIEQAVRGHLLEHVGPALGHFYPHKQRHNAGATAKHHQHHGSIEPQ